MRERDLGWVIDYYRQMTGTAKGRMSRDEVRRKKQEEAGSQPFDKGRDPVSAASSIDQVFEDFQWKNQISKATLFAQWAELVGKETSSAAYPEALVNGVLQIKCISTAWATQLNLISDRYLQVLQKEFPELGIVSLRFQGPAAPSWKKGPKSVPGRGPRDTYG